MPESFPPWICHRCRKENGFGSSVCACGNPQFTPEKEPVKLEKAEEPKGIDTESAAPLTKKKVSKKKVSKKKSNA